MKMRLGRAHEPTVMMHHVKELQLRIAVIGLVLVVGMVVGYLLYEPLFNLLRAPLSGPLHYTSPAGSFNFIIKICLLVGVIAALPTVVYNLVMFIQPALREKFSRLRVYTISLVSLLLAALGAAFAFLVIIPLALKFFYKFQVDGLIALISADEYLHFVVSVAITFIIIFQLPLVISFIDHITPLPPKKMLKAEKFIIIGSLMVGVIVPFALDPAVQLLIASPIVILYNLSIGIVLLQQRARRRRNNHQSIEHSALPVTTIPLRQTVIPTPSPPPPRRRPRQTMDIVKPISYS